MNATTPLKQDSLERALPAQPWLRPTVVLFSVMTLLTGLAYPLLTTVTAQAVFAEAANGSLITREGKLAGSRLIGQSFTQPQYFWGRPSATAPTPYNGAASSGSNLGPRNPVLADAVAQRVSALKAADPGNPLPIPVDLVAASGSGLDPHISPAAAAYQVARVARARAMSVQQVHDVVQAHTQQPALAILGEPVVNVLTLNIALDDLQNK